MRYTPKPGGTLSEFGDVTEGTRMDGAGSELAVLQLQHEQLKTELKTMQAKHDAGHMVTTPVGGILRDSLNETPKVCFGDFWIGTCSRPKCEYCGANALSNGTKYWEHAMKQLISHKYKSCKDVVVWIKDGKVIKPGLVEDRDRRMQATMQQVGFADEYFPGETESDISDKDFCT